MSFGYRVLPLVVAAVLLAVLLWYGGNGWLGFALGVFAGGFIGDWLRELRMATVPCVALAVAVSLVCVGFAFVLDVSDVLVGFLTAAGAFLAFRMIFGRYVENRRQPVD